MALLSLCVVFLCCRCFPVQEESLAETRMALHHAENGLMFISSVVDAVMELHPSTFRQLASDIDGNPSK